MSSAGLNFRCGGNSSGTRGPLLFPGVAETLMGVP